LPRIPAPAREFGGLPWTGFPGLRQARGYPDLRNVCESYPDGIEQVFLIADSGPTMAGTSARLHSDFPGWWSGFTETELVVVSLGGADAGMLEQLAALAGGTFVAR
jgi:hypothetical protein